MLDTVMYELQRHKRLADAALEQLNDEQFFDRPAAAANSAALVVKHLAGNLNSRWTDFLTTDGDKPTRKRDQEFVIEAADTREGLMAAWEQGWNAVLTSVGNLAPDDCQRTVTIRGEPHSVTQAVLRGLTHAAYHVGQIMFIVRCLKPDAKWLTIAPGQSGSHVADYLNTDAKPAYTSVRRV